MGPLSIVTALMAGLLFQKYLSHFRTAEVLIMLVIAANAIPLLNQYEPLSGDNHKFISDFMNPRAIRQRGLRATVLDEYLPLTAQKDLIKRAPLGAVFIPSGTTADSVTPTKINHTYIQLDVKTARQAEIHLARWYFPGWRATLNGSEHPVSVADSGAIRLNIPKGEHQVVLWLPQPAIRLWGMAVSGISIILFFVLLLFRKTPKSIPIIN